jgi:uncharacterized repeat protein (TIGR01451 family)
MYGPPSGLRAVRAVLLVGAVVLATPLTGASVGVDADTTSFSVGASADRSTVEPGETVTVTVTVENTGPTSVSSAGLTTTVSGVDGSVVGANSTAATGVTADHRVLFRTVAPGETATATVAVLAGSNASGTLSVTATVVAGFDADEVSRDASAAVSVGSNSAPIALPVAVNTTDGTSVTAPLNASDSDGDALTYAVETPPGNGTVSVGDGRFTYTPDDGFTGWDSFRYRATDGRNGTDTARVDVYVEESDDVPTADGGRDRTVAALSTVTLNASGSVDPDGDALTYSWTQVGGPTVNLTGAGTATPTFVAPNVTGEVTLAFEIDVSDGNANDTDTVAVTVEPAGNSHEQHESGVSQRVFAAATGEDGSLERPDVIATVRGYLTGGSVNGVAVTRPDVLALVRYYLTN